jgi:hypothetical protein
MDIGAGKQPPDTDGRLSPRPETSHHTVRAVRGMAPRSGRSRRNSLRFTRSYPRRFQPHACRADKLESHLDAEDALLPVPPDQAVGRMTFFGSGAEPSFGSVANVGPSIRVS